MKKISVRGGPATTIHQTDNFLGRPEWGDDDTIVFAEYVRNGPGTGLRRISANGGTPERLTSLEEDADIGALSREVTPSAAPTATPGVLSSLTIHPLQATIAELPTKGMFLWGFAGLRN